MLKIKDIKTGMRVKTQHGDMYYVVQDWTHLLESDGKVRCNALLISTNPSEEEFMFYGFLNYDENLKWFGQDGAEWNITNVYIFTGEDLQMMNRPEHESEWKEITEPVTYDQELLMKYFAKFE